MAGWSVAGKRGTVDSGGQCQHQQEEGGKDG